MTAPLSLAYQSTGNLSTNQLHLTKSKTAMIFFQINYCFVLTITRLIYPPLTINAFLLHTNRYKDFLNILIQSLTMHSLLFTLNTLIPILKRFHAQKTCQVMRIGTYQRESVALNCIIIIIAEVKMCKTFFCSRCIMCLRL